MPLDESDGALCPGLGVSAALIAQSRIMVEGPFKRLPAGFDEVEIAVLDWIAAEGRRAGRSIVRSRSSGARGGR
jgi:hypothetical protein